MLSGQKDYVLGVLAASKRDTTVVTIPDYPLFLQDDIIASVKMSTCQLYQLLDDL